MSAKGTVTGSSTSFRKSKVGTTLQEHRNKLRFTVQGKSTKLPRELRGLMGEANLRYARGEHEDTIKMCLEIIRRGK